MYKEDLALNNLQWMICHKTQSTEPNKSYAIQCIITHIRISMRNDGIIHVRIDTASSGKNEVSTRSNPMVILKTYLMRMVIIYIYPTPVHK